NRIAGWPSFNRSTNYPITRLSNYPMLVNERRSREAGAGQREAEARAASLAFLWTPHQLQHAAVRSGNAERDRQAEPRRVPARPRREERLEDPFLHLFRHARPIVGNFQHRTGCRRRQQRATHDLTASSGARDRLLG